MKFPSAGAFKTNMIVNLTDDSLNITPGLCLRPGFLPEQLIHELIHAVSSKQNMSFDENGITYTKTGTKINYYDKELNDLNQYDNISSDLLNEGMTDYLTFVVTGDSNKVHYYFGTVLADILNKNSNSLINAYFSKDLTDLVDFIHEFDASQDVISYKEIVEVDQSNMLGDLSQRIMQGAVNYCLANSKENELEQNVEYIKQRLSYLDDYYCLDNGSWSDNINFKSRNK